MPMRRGMKKTAPRRRPAAARRRPAPRRGAKVALPKRNTGNFASLTEQYSIGVTAGQVYDFTTNLSKLARSSAIASGFQYYRITSVEMRFKPLYDTFTGLSSALVPNLHFQYDKSGTLAGLTGPGFEAIGTKAYRLDDKTLVRKWAPSVLMGDNDTSISGTIGQFKVAPWLPVIDQISGSQNTPKHYGATFYIDKINASDGTVYDVDVVVSTQFRKPSLIGQQGVSNPEPPVVVQGVVAGVDLSLNPTLHQ